MSRIVSVRVSNETYDEWMRLVDELVGYKKPYPKNADLFSDMIKAYKKGRVKPRFG